MRACHVSVIISSMRSIKYRFVIGAVVLLSATLASFGQTVEVLNAQAQVNKVLEESGRYFREGMETLKANRRSDSGEKFDRSVETFLLSTINIQRDQKLQACYSQLIETVYRIEYPTDAQAPQIRPLAATCGWKWSESEFKLADEVAQLIKPVKKGVSSDAATLASIAPGAADPSQFVGFNSQTFEPSPLDELSKLELTVEEQQIDLVRIAGMRIGDDHMHQPVR